MKLSGVSLYLTITLIAIAIFGFTLAVYNQDQIQSLNIDLASKSATISSHQAKIVDLEAENQKLEGELSSVRANLDYAQKQVLLRKLDENKLQDSYNALWSFYASCAHSVSYLKYPIDFASQFPDNPAALGDWFVEDCVRSMYDWDKYLSLKTDRVVE